MSVKIQSLLDAFPQWLHLESGSPQYSIDSLCPPTSPKKNGILFLGMDKFLKAPSLPEVACVVHPKNWTPPSDHFESTVFISSSNVMLSMAKVAQKFFPITANKKAFDGMEIHSSATISKSAQLGENVIVGPGVVIGENVSIGNQTTIGPNSTIEPNVEIGSDCHIHAQTLIAHGVKIGDRCEVLPNCTIGSEGFGYAQDEKFNHYRIPHYGSVVLENDVHIGAGVHIDRGTFEDSHIGEGTKIDNYCHFGHNIRIGKSSLLTGGIVTAGSVTIGSHVVIGGRTTITGHIEIGDGVQISGLSAVTKSIKEPGQYGGHPIEKLKDHIRTKSSLKFVTQIRKDVSNIKKKLDLD